MYKFRYLYFILFFLVSSFLFPQKKEKIKALENEMRSCKEDSVKVKKLIKLARLYFSEDFQKSNQTGMEALALANKIKFFNGQIAALDLLADGHWYKANYDKAMQFYYRSYRISDSLNNKRAVAHALYNLGWISCVQQHNYNEVHYLYRSYAISKELKDTIGMLSIYNALASTYSDKYASLKLKNDFDSSVVYFKKGIDLGKKSKRYNELSAYYMNLGQLFFSDKDFKSAKFYFLSTLSTYQDKKDSTTIVSIEARIAQCDAGLGLATPKTVDHLIRAKNYFKRQGIKEYELESMEGLAEVYYALGKFKEGYEVYKDFVALRKEADRIAYTTSLSNMENNYSLEKSEASVSQLTQAKEIEELKNKKKNYFILVLIAIAIVVLIITYLLFKQNKLKQLTNVQLQEQNTIIKEKKEEIEHSIQYAKGIQQAILPDIHELNDSFKESFIFYKPKDVVSGDFYWFAKVGDDFYCVAADCTGHGVPGALMSIIGTDKINQAIYEKKITDPDKILSFLNVQIKNVLKQHSDASTQKDGMDIAILKFNSNNTSVEYSAANRPLFLVRNNELIEYKATKTAIAGFTPNNQVFDTHLIEIKKNDGLFIFTDGYADQFGGPSGGKKIMTKKLKELLISGSKLTSNKQKELLENYFLDWKGNFEQTDDVLVMGITI